MGIYLPTISFLIEHYEIPDTAVESWNDVTHLLEKYHDHEFCYKCTTRGYGHLVCFTELAELLQISGLKNYPSKDIFVKEQTQELSEKLKSIENIILETPEIINGLLAKREENLWNILQENHPEYCTEDRKRYHLQRIDFFRQLNIKKIYQQAPLLKDISEFDLQDKFTDKYDEVIAVLYWLKTQLYLLAEATKQDKAFAYITLTP